MANEPLDDAPLIVSLSMDSDTFTLLNTLRKRHFPAERNHLDAHITLFHALPSEREAEILTRIAGVCRETAPMELRFPGVRSLGRGVAVVVESAELMRVRAELARVWQPMLSPQDAQGFRPHVTIQNKVSVEAARALLHKMGDWEPMRGMGTGITLSRYRGGAWETVRTVPFAPDVENTPTNGTIAG